MFFWYQTVAHPWSTGSDGREQWRRKQKGNIEGEFTGKLTDQCFVRVCDKTCHRQSECLYTDTQSHVFAPQEQYSERTCEQNVPDSQVDAKDVVQRAARIMRNIIEGRRYRSRLLVEFQRVCMFPPSGATHAS